MLKIEIIINMDIKSAIKYIKNSFSDSSDLIIKELEVNQKKCAFFYIDGMSDKLLLEQNIIEPLLLTASFEHPYAKTLPKIVKYSEQIKTDIYEQSPQIIAEGDIVFAIDNFENVFVFSLRKFEKRAVTEPPTSSVLKGPREGFIEEIKTNISLLRRRIKSPSFTIKMLTAGRYTQTSIAVAYINGIASDDVVNEITERINSIDIDGIVDSSYLTSFLESKKISIFNQVATSEKPDVVTAKLLEGRVAIIVDGSPLVITAPYVIFEDIQDAYDYYTGDWRASMVRIFRFFGAALTVLLPGAYVALQVFHFHLLPLKFLITLLSATTGIPFPPAVEMLFVVLLFEILYQASIRMPRFLGISLSVVGAIVLGDTAVKSGLISSPAVLIVAMSAIGIFCVPDQVGTLSIFRFLFLCAGAVLGIFGIIVLLILTITYLASIDNLGAPYLAPFAPTIFPDLKDAFLKDSPLQMKKRPYSIPTSNRTRMQNKGVNKIK